MSQPQKVKEEKKNTDAWKLKQQEKKKKQATQPEATLQAQQKKADKKQKKTKSKEQKKQQVRLQKQQQKTTQKSQSITQVQQPKPSYRQLTKIYNKLNREQRTQNIPYQQGLIINYMNKQIYQHDIVLYIGDKKWSPSCPQVYIKNFNNCEDAELVCLYPDVSYFVEGSVTKIFVQAQFIFANGSLLVKKGALNIILLAKYYNILVVACGGSWNYNGWAPLTEQALTQRYSESILQKYDWIQTKYLKSCILQVGMINPRLFSIYPPIIYKSLDLTNIEW